MTTTDDERHCRICLMLMNGGTKISKALFEKCVTDLTPKNHIPHPWTLDHFLKTNTTKILGTQKGRAKQNIIFPAGGATSQVEEWDLYMYCFFLIEICGVEGEVRMDIEQLRKMRNKICHQNEPKIDIEKYNRTVDKLEVIYERLLKEICDEELTNEVNKILKSSKEDPLSCREIILVMHEFYKTDLETREILTQQGAVSDIKTLMQEVSEIKKKQDFMLNRESTDSVSEDLTETCVDLQIKNCDCITEKFVLNDLASNFKMEPGQSSSEQLKQISEQERAELTAAVKNTIDRFALHKRTIGLKAVPPEAVKDDFYRTMQRTAETKTIMSRLSSDLPPNFIKDSLKVYLKSFYSKSTSFNTFCRDIEGIKGLSLQTKPSFGKIDIKQKEVTAMNQNEALIEILDMPYNIENIQRLKTILLVAKDTTTSANCIVSFWLNHFDYNIDSMNSNYPDGVFLLQITDSDCPSDLNIMMEERFEMKKSYYFQRILVIFECIHTDHLKLKAIYDLACSCTFKMCKFLIITKIEKQIVLDLKLDMQCILIADRIDALHVFQKQSKEEIDGQILSKSIHQIVSKRECTLWKKDAITKISFENIHPLNKTAMIRVPKDIKKIEFHGCSNKIQVIHSAHHLDIYLSEPSTKLPSESMFTPTLTSIAINFKSSNHVFHKREYESFAFKISRATHIVSLRLCNMKFGKKDITVELQEKDIENVRHSVESKEDFCRFGARILGPHLGNISFHREDVEAEERNSLVRQIMLDLICYELVKRHSSVSECYPSEMKDGAIKLICFVNDEVRINSFNGFPLVKENCNGISKESLLAENSRNREDNIVVKATEEEFEDINETLSFHAEALMTSHRNLEAVKISFVQPKDKTLMQSNLCIVLYCRAKGYIPYGDVRFPRTLNHPFKNKLFRIDVREGFFSTCHFRAGRSSDFNTELALGSSIGEVYGNRAATLGSFVKIKETNETCFLTVRHVFGPPSRADDSIVGLKVVQPADVHLPPDADGLQNRQCGEIITSDIGGQIDACLVKISQERLPTNGQFIQMTKEDLNLAGLKKQPVYNDGAFIDAKGLTVKDQATRRIIKIGCATSLTKGTLSTTDGCVRETLEYSSLETLYNGSKEKFQITSQLMVDSYYKKVFCQAGDSGSAVFLVDDNDHLHCIGMVIGFICNDLTAIVTPIDNILKILGHKLGKTLELKKFRETDEMDQS